MLFTCVLAALCFFSSALAKEVRHHWNITWVQAAPDGYVRPVIGVNGKWPCPTLDLELNDRIIVEVYNGLGNQSTGIHWHGISQKGSNFMDGSPGVTQCRIPPGGQMTYDFVVSKLLRREDKADSDRSIVLGPSGGILMIWASIQMVSGVL